MPNGWIAADWKEGAGMASIAPLSRRRDFRERTDGGDDEAKEHDLFQVLPPLTGIAHSYNAIAAIEVPGHGDVEANHQIHCPKLRKAVARCLFRISLPFLVGEGLSLSSFVQAAFGGRFASSAV
jgi:hypothetical protein